MFFRYFYNLVYLQLVRVVQCFSGIFIVVYLQLVRVVLMFFRYFYSSISAASEGGANVFQVFL